MLASLISVGNRVRDGLKLAQKNKIIRFVMSDVVRADVSGSGGGSYRVDFVPTPLGDKDMYVHVVLVPHTSL